MIFCDLDDMGEKSSPCFHEGCPFWIDYSAFDGCGISLALRMPWNQDQ
jgi:hypothetical protein